MKLNEEPSQSRAHPHGLVLVVCTGNQVRSPMAAAMLNRFFVDREVPLSVESAGFVSEGAPCPPEVAEVMVPSGFDLSYHRSRIAHDRTVTEADLVLGMTRQHVIDLSLLAPGAWQRIFTLAELARLGETSGPRRPEESLATWVTRTGAARRRADLLNLPLSEDIPDPMGRPIRAYLGTRDLIASLISRLADLMAPV